MFFPAETRETEITNEPQQTTIEENVHRFQVAVNDICAVFLFRICVNGGDWTQRFLESAKCSSGDVNRPPLDSRNHHSVTSAAGTPNGTIQADSQNGRTGKFPEFAQGLEQRETRAESKRETQRGLSGPKLSALARSRTADARLYVRRRGIAGMQPLQRSRRWMERPARRSR
jgi:hypothetical protein